VSSVVHLPAVHLPKVQPPAPQRPHSTPNEQPIKHM
jgi:hypothetical protein